MNELLPKPGYYKYIRQEEGKSFVRSKIILICNFKDKNENGFGFYYTTIAFLEPTEGRKDSSYWTCGLDFFKENFTRLTEDEVLLYLI